jgi:DNA-directed RNA polymerase specialized sigma24 family protein
MPPDDSDSPLGTKDAPPVSAPSLPRAANDSPASRDDRPGITLAVLHAYLNRPDTQRHIRNVVAGALGRRANRALVDDLANDAQEAALGTWKQADSEETMPAWVDGIARNKVREHFGELREEAKVFDRGGDPEGPNVLYTPTDDDASGWMIGSWLREQVADTPHERELYETLCYKARSKKTFAQVAAEKGTTLPSLSNRIYRLRQKYEPQWKQHRREQNRTVLLWLGFAIALAVAWWLLHRPDPVPVRPDVYPPPPSATASAPPPEPFMPAEPTEKPQPQPQPQPHEEKPGLKPRP